MKHMIERIADNSDNIALYFPVNSNFPCEDEEKTENKYGVKRQGPSIPPPEDRMMDKIGIITISI
jgi:hypothetical protein